MPPSASVDTLLQLGREQPQDWEERPREIPPFAPCASGDLVRRHRQSHRPDAGRRPRPAIEAGARADGRSTAGVETKLSLPLSKATGPQTVFVRFTKTSAADASAAAQPAGAAAAKQAAKSARAAANWTSSSVVGELRTSDRKAHELYRTSNAVTGVAVVADADSIRALAARTDVAKISVLVPKKLSNAHAAVLTRVLDTWQDLGLFGDDMRVGVIDTGIDYTHANFGGPGTPEAFDAVDPTDADGRCSRRPRSSGVGTSPARTTTPIRTIRPCSPPLPTTTRSTATATAPTSPGRRPASASTATAPRLRATTRP